MDPKFPKEKNAQVTMNSFQKFVPPDQEPDIDIYTSNALDFSVRVKKMCWNYDESTPDRSEANGIAKNAVRRVREFLLFFLVSRVFQKSCVDKLLECFCSWRWRRSK